MKFTFKNDKFDVGQFWVGQNPITKVQLDNIREWQKNLRSRKYIQNKTGRQLKIGNEYCCLGVYSEIKNRLSPDGFFIGMDAENDMQPTCAIVNDVSWFRNEIGLTQEFWTLNDRLRYTFSEIADFIDELLKHVTVEE